MRDRGPTAGRVFAVLVTYRRPRALATMLDRLSAQELPFETLFVIDNGSRKPLGVIHLHDLVKAGL